ncbi:MAG: hypothetical protein ACTSQ5_03915 [Promethearchaeota archaeon]
MGEEPTKAIKKLVEKPIYICPVCKQNLPDEGVTKCPICNSELLELSVLVRHPEGDVENQKPNLKSRVCLLCCCFPFLVFVGFILLVLRGMEEA